MTGSEPREGDSPIEAYLDELVAALPMRRPRALRQLLAEAEAHLRDDAAQGVASGMTPDAAELAAVTRFGPAGHLAAAERDRLKTPLRALASQFAATAVLLGGVGAVAVGASGAISAGIAWFAGTRVLAAPAPGAVLSGSDCARWLALDPAARTCRAAATADWASEVIWYRLAVGLLGVLCLAGLVALRRRTAATSRWALLPSAVSDTIALTLFGVGGLWTLGKGLDAVAGSAGDGSGQWLSAAVVALLAAAGFGARLARDLRSGAGPASIR
jgi:hypothetical protein